ncbi:MAG: ATP-dependent DNA ligase [Ardenticatenaceae bacterium]|nr:ATP-dependent DNA ligase [Ardenticatenaceae bacterium]HBY94577.1 ATP-dependent DNA ligase [Chloroflexota bacterium]
MDFETVARAFAELEETSSRKAMTETLLRLLQHTSVELLPPVVLLLQGKIAPNYEGIELNMGAQLAARAIADAAAAPVPMVEERLQKLGDLGLVARDLLETQRASEAGGGTSSSPRLRVDDVFAALIEIAEATGRGSVQWKVDLLADLLRRATALEATFIVRTVTGNLRLGVGDATLLEALALAFGGGPEARPVLERAYNLTSDLPGVAVRVASGGIAAAAAVEITLGKPVRPMLAERLDSPEEILDAMGGHCAAEYKYDGERFQAHLGPGLAAIFSRRQENITHQFPDLVEALRVAIPRPAIVEGEAVALDPVSGALRPFQDLLRRKRKSVDADILAQYPVVAFLFDLLYLDGEDRTEDPNEVRREALEALVRPGEQVQLATRRVVTAVAELKRFFDEAIAEGSEGLICKQIGPGTGYRAGKRGYQWVKYKRDIHGQLTDSLDLVIVAAFYGRGRRAGTYGSFLLAVYNVESDTFETLTRCGAGLTDADLARLPERLRPSLLDHRHPRVSALIEPDVWFAPSQVFEVIGQELSLSPRHTCAFGVLEPERGLSLRFPRFTGRIRSDKAPEDATSTAEVIEMYRQQFAHR